MEKQNNRQNQSNYELTIKTAKKLTCIIDREVEKNELISKDNKDMNEKQRKLIALLSLKDRSLEKVKANIMSIIRKYPNSEFYLHCGKDWVDFDKAQLRTSIYREPMKFDVVEMYSNLMKLKTLMNFKFIHQKFMGKVFHKF